ncbi:MAG: 6-carboxytetrahydropterin synthase QueD [Planctomycetota bacterium]|jgi:6-pyruvoyltetrahydropterin/6-carboxytetrahydropterin synthase|nr:6-carboxytetrahydropterin synthase QueD [Planctomycetota bacterium]
MFQLRVEDYFASAHQLRDYRGKCENLHGHNWRVGIVVSGERLDSLGMLVDFAVLKKILKRNLDRLDHSFLNRIPPFDSINPTSENLAEHIFALLSGELPAGAEMTSVTVWESDRCAAVYRRDSPGAPDA